MNNYKKILFLSWGLLLLGMYSCSQDLEKYYPDNDNIQYQGRILFADLLKPVFAFPGISIKIKFDGTTVSAKFRGYKGVNPQPNYFNVFLDGEFVNKFVLGDTTISVVCVQNIKKGIHQLEITKRTESMLGKVEFLGFEIDGLLLKPDLKPIRKLEFVGNSITCGYGNEDSPTGGFNSKNENNYLAFGAVCSRLLNAEYRAIAYSGRGVIYNYACSKGDSIPGIYEKYLADENAFGINKYAHSSYLPDIIVVNLGTNDHNCEKTTDDNFKNAYTGFIAKLKRYHPKAKIVCLTGPMISTKEYKDQIEYIVNESGGESNGIYFFHQTPIVDSRFKGGHGHPNTKMAEINARELADFIEKKNLLVLH